MFTGHYPLHWGHVVYLLAKKTTLVFVDVTSVKARCVSPISA